MAKRDDAFYLSVLPLAVLLISSGPVFAQESAPDAPQSSQQQAVPYPSPGLPEYLDDRSTPEALIRSYYNAVNRQEYARAYSYYAEGALDRGFDAFKRGYAETASVRIEIGDIEAEGAAGSTYWTIPLAIESTVSDGTTEVFGGCYTVRLANPAIQDMVPFVPMSIVTATLTPTDHLLTESVPSDCESS